MTKVFGTRRKLTEAEVRELFGKKIDHGEKMLWYSASSYCDNGRKNRGIFFIVVGVICAITLLGVIIFKAIAGNMAELMLFSLLIAFPVPLLIIMLGIVELTAAMCPRYYVVTDKQTVLFRCGLFGVSVIERISHSTFDNVEIFEKPSGQVMVLRSNERNSNKIVLSGVNNPEKVEKIILDAVKNDKTAV